VKKVENMQISRREKSGKHARKSLCMKKERNLPKSCRSRKKKEKIRKKKKEKKKFNIRKKQGT